MINIFLVSAEHHFIQVEQALIHYNLNDKNLIWFVKNDEGLWIERIIREKKIKNYIVSESWIFSELKNNSSKVSTYIQKLKEVKRQYKSIKLYYNQYSSDFSLLAIHLLRPIEIILMDEGTASFSVCALRKNIMNRIKIKHFIKSFYYKKLILFPKKITLFTQYDLNCKKEDKIVKYFFSKIHNKLFFDNKEIAILGSSMTEVGLIEENYYLSLLEVIKENYPKKQLLYFSHRKEENAKKDKIKEIGFTVIDNNIPFEFYFEKIKICPAIIGSFFSPTLLNLEAKFHVIPQFIIFKFDLDKLSYNRKVIEEIYNSYEMNNNLKIEVL